MGSADGNLRIFDVRTNADPIVLEPKSRQVRDCQFNPHDNCTLSACFDNGTMQIFDIRQPGHFVKKIFVHDGAASCLAYHPTRQGIVACGGALARHTSGNFGQAFKLKIVAPERDASTLRAMKVLGGVRSIAWRPGSTSSASMDIAMSLDSPVDNDVLVWDAENATNYWPLARFGGHSNHVTRIAFVSRSSVDAILSVGKDGKLLCHQYRAGESIDSQRREAVPFCFSSTEFATVKTPNASVCVRPILDRTVVQTLFNEYRYEGSNLSEIASWNERSAKFVGNLQAARFWSTFSLGFAFEMNLMNSAQTAKPVVFRDNASASGPGGGSNNASNEQRVASLRTPMTKSLLGLNDSMTPPPLTTIRLDSDGLLRVISMTTSSSGSSLLTRHESSRSSSHAGAGGDGFGVAGGGSGGIFNLLRDLRDVDESVSSVFQIRATHPFIRLATNDVVSTISNPTPETITHDLPHVAVVPCKKEHGTVLDKTQNRFATFRKARDASICQSLDSLVDYLGDVQTAATVVLMFDYFDKRHMFGPILPLVKRKRWLLAYSDLLKRLDMIPEALEILRSTNLFETKMNSSDKDEEQEMRIGIGCGVCSEPLPSVGNMGECLNCESVVSKCAVCRRVVFGQYVWCRRCGHGGHLDHMREWFEEEKNEFCPTGCNCQCAL